MDAGETWDLTEISQLPDISDEPHRNEAEVSFNENTLILFSQATGVSGYQDFQNISSPVSPS